MKLVSILTLLPIIIALLSSCAPSETPCKKAMRHAYVISVGTGTEGKKPKECNGVEDAVLADYAMEILQEQWEVTNG